MEPRYSSVVVNTLDFHAEGHWFNATCCVVFLHKKLYPTLSLFTQMYKWVTATYCWVVTL